MVRASHRLCTQFEFRQRQNQLQSSILHLSRKLYHAIPRAQTPDETPRPHLPQALKQARISTIVLGSMGDRQGVGNGPRSKPGGSLVTRLSQVRSWTYHSASSRLLPLMFFTQSLYLVVYLTFRICHPLSSQCCFACTPPRYELMNREPLGTTSPYNNC